MKHRIDRNISTNELTPPSDTIEASHSIPLPALLTKTKANQKHGLTHREAEERIKAVGLNQLREAPQESWVTKLVRQFKSIVILILVIAAIISGVMGDWIETWAILAIVILNGGLGFLQEERAEHALVALRRLSNPQARVVRDSRLRSIPARDLVPGDLIELEAGDFTPADARLIQAYGLKSQEAPLTGESQPVEKACKDALPRDTALGDRANMVYMGTTILAGKASAIVVGTGMNTEIGRIAKLLSHQKIEPTPLQQRLTELGRVLIALCLGLVAGIVLLYGMRGGDLADIFLFAVSLAVAVIPEGLPAVVTIALALGLTRMAKRNALIRRLPSVETLGSVTVICSDKTGTLTRNEMMVRTLITGIRTYDITGEGYEPKGDFYLKQDDKPPQKVDPRHDKDLIHALTIGTRCNHATLSSDKETPGNWTIIGDPTEGSLITAALKAGVAANSHDEPFLAKMPFDSERRLMSVVHCNDDNRPCMMTKGAPEAVIAHCNTELFEGEIRPLTETRRQWLLDQNKKLAAQALRTLGLAFRDFPKEHDAYSENDLVFAGIVGMIDPPRSEVKEAVKKCKTAGIQPVMITGDHPATALAIANELGIANADARAVTGKELDLWDDETLEAQVPNIAVYARVSAEHKLRVIQAWKKKGAIVAMTGDGVNDAPAVKTADIGIAMGITGTDVTKEASAMVLTDDNFASIVNAVEEGRGILDNIQNILHFLLSGNTSEILLVSSAVFFGWPIPLSAIQILWINLITDGLPALALATERPDRDVMQRQPRPTKEPLFTWQRGSKILQNGALLAAAMIGGFWWALHVNAETKGNIPQAQAVAFCICALAQLAFSFACRSRYHTFFSLGAWSNRVLLVAITASVGLQVFVITVPFVQPFFFVEPPQFGWTTWAVVGALALLPVSIVETGKLLRAAVRRERGAT